MQRLLRTAAALLFCALMFCTLACAQGNGPTVHKVIGSFTQSTTTGITGNCWYRGTASGTYATPGTCSTSPITTFTDTAVTQGATYYYAVTAYTNSSGTVVESAYSNEISATIPSSPNAPTGLGKTTVAKAEPKKDEDELAEMLYLIRSEPSKDPSDQTETVASLHVVSVE